MHAGLIWHAGGICHTGGICHAGGISHTGVICDAGVNLEETEHPELLMPPPTYDDAVNVNLYPPTPQMQRNVSRKQV